MSEISSALPERQNEAAKYSNLFTTWSSVFNNAFWNSKSATYDYGQQTSSILPLTLGIVDADAANNITVALLNDIVKNHYHFTTGAVGTKFLLPYLSSIGQTDIAVHIASSVVYPSWGYMIYQRHQVPATSLWEIWGGSIATEPYSHSSTLFAPVSAWFYSNLVGIKQPNWSRGFKHIIIDPPANELVYSNLRMANGSIETPNGVITTSWEMYGGDRVCALAPEGAYIRLNCETGVISKIDFASYGTPKGDCGGHFRVDSTCSASSSLKTVEAKCLGRKTCTVPANNQLFGDPCYNLFKYLAVVGSCSNGISIKMKTVIPQNTKAIIKVPKLYLKQVVISEQANIIWNNGVFIPGATSGITNAQDFENKIQLYVGGGTYQFTLTGTRGNPICASGTEVKRRNWPIIHSQTKKKNI